MSDELKPCPFCGGPGVWVESREQVMCAWCHVSPCPTRGVDFKSDVMPGAQAWNTRTADTRAEALEGLLRECLSVGLILRHMPDDLQERIEKALGEVMTRPR